MTLQQAARIALDTDMDTDDAITLSDILQTFSKIVSEALAPEAQRLGLGPQWVNTHPICCLLIDRLDELNGRPSGLTGIPFNAFKAVETLAIQQPESVS